MEVRKHIRLFCKLTWKKGLPTSLAPSREMSAMAHHRQLKSLSYSIVDARRILDLLGNGITKRIGTGRDERVKQKLYKTSESNRN